MATKKVMKKVTKKAMKLVFEGIKAPVYVMHEYTFDTWQYKPKDLRNKKSYVYGIITLQRMEKFEIFKIESELKTRTYYWLFENRLISGTGNPGAVYFVEQTPLYEVELVKQVPGSNNRWIVKRK